MTITIFKTAMLTSILAATLGGCLEEREVADDFVVLADPESGDAIGVKDLETGAYYLGNEHVVSEALVTTGASFELGDVECDGDALGEASATGVLQRPTTMSTPGARDLCDDSDGGTCWNFRECSGRVCVECHGCCERVVDNPGCANDVWQCWEECTDSSSSALR